jgi:hypothetical protein
MATHLRTELVLDPRMDDFLAKPIEPEALCGRLLICLSHRQRALNGPRTAASASGGLRPRYCWTREVVSGRFRLAPGSKADVRKASPAVRRERGHQQPQTEPELPLKRRRRASGTGRFRAVRARFLTDRN